jgi:regulator of replication initiation timing
MGKVLVLTLLVIVIVTGCSNNGENEVEALKETIVKLTDANKKLELENEQLELELENIPLNLKKLIIENQKLRILNNELQALNEQLELDSSTFRSEVIRLSDAATANHIHLVEEGIKINSKLFSPEELSEDVIIDLLGKPLYVEEYVVYDHDSRVKLSYDNFTIRFVNDNNGKQSVKALTIKDSDIVTQRGITVGSTKHEVTQAYGKLYYGITSYGRSNSNTHSLFYGDKTGLRFSLEDGLVKEITIEFMYE